MLLKYTYTGDANADGRIDADDYTRADRGFLSRQDPSPLNNLHGWLNGDFNYDETIDILDYFQIDRAMALQGSPLALGAPSGVSAPAAAVPEPGMLTPMLVLTGLLGARRRSHRLHEHGQAVVEHDPPHAASENRIELGKERGQASAFDVPIEPVIAALDPRLR